MSCVVLAAHPDDETIGAASVIARHASRVTVVHATHGAPRDARFQSSRALASPTAYGRLRQREVQRALAMAGLGADRIRQLGFVDQEAAHHLVALTLRVRELLLELQPLVLLVHPYEGGHPDHDACAFAARAALRLMLRAGVSGGRRPRLIEMTSYHRWQGTLRTGAFLDGGAQELVKRLSRQEQALKRRMLDCFESQVDVLRPFAVDEERFRPAPDYDFTRRPHPEPLHYEVLGWPIRGQDFCRAAASALRQLGLCPPEEDRRARVAAEGPCA